MKKTIITLSVAIFGLTALTLSSCKKDNTNANAQFIGTYNGTTTSISGPNPDTVVVTAGSNSNAIVITEKQAGAVLNGTVSSTVIAIPSQSLTITPPGSGALTGTAVGSGALTSGNTLNFAITDTVSGSPIPISFVGTKQ